MDAMLATHLSLPSARDALTPRTVACAAFLGAMVCLANMYFGLQAGMVNAMPMQSALLGFAFFRGIQPHISNPLSPTEITLIEIIAGAVGLAPFTSGCTSFIPALEFLATPKENGPTTFSFAQLLLWSIATCGLGIVAGAPFRNLFILRERLRFPSATATGTLVGVLFQKEEIIARAKLSKAHLSPPKPCEAGPGRESGLDISQLPRLEVDTRSEVTVGSETFSAVSDEIPALDGNGPVITVLLYSFAGSMLVVSHVS